MVNNQTEYQKAWRRFRRNRPALFGLWFVVLAILVSVFGYTIAPDHSPDANHQIPEMALAAPGSSTTLLKVRLAREPEPAGFIKRLLSGTPVSFRYLPVTPETLRQEGDSVFFQQAKRPDAIHLVNLFFSVEDRVASNGAQYQFRTGTGEVQQVSKAAVLEKWHNGSALTIRTFPLGADKYGRCILSRLLLGFRVSMTVGLISVVISLSIGLLMGILGGYYGGRLDDLVMLVVNTVWSIPTLLLVFAIVLALGRGIGIIFLAVGLTMWVDVARIVRGQTLALRGLPFIEAAQSMGLGDRRILLRHILPNLLGPVLVVAAGNFATAILVESGLSYLGFGVQPPAPSWGGMLNENYGYALGGKPLLALAPAIAIALTVLAFNLVGNGLRDALDVKSS